MPACDLQYAAISLPAMNMSLLQSRRRKDQGLYLASLALLVVMTICLVQRAGLVMACPTTVTVSDLAHQDSAVTADADDCELTDQLLRGGEIVELPILLSLFTVILLVTLLQRIGWHVLSSPDPPLLRRHVLFCTFRE